MPKLRCLKCDQAIPSMFSLGLRIYRWHNGEYLVAVCGKCGEPVIRIKEDSAGGAVRDHQPA